jgi:ABC-type multidrug transport system fused ATPase/permease subunit
VARRARLAWRRLSPFFGASRLKIATLSIAAIGAGVAEAALLALVAAVAEALSLGESNVEADLGPIGIQADMMLLLAVGIALALVRGALQVLMAYLPASMSATAMAQLRRRLFDAFTRSSWPVQASERDGHFQALMTTHVNKTCQAIIALGMGISSFLMFLALLASALLLSLPTAVVIAVASGGLFLLLRPLSRRLRANARALSAENVDYSKNVQEVVLMAEEVQVFGASESYRDQFHQRIERVRQPLLRTRFLSKAVPALYQSLALLLLIVALAVVAVTSSATIASLGAVVLILIRSLTYGQQILTAVTAVEELIPFMHRLGDAIDHYTDHPQQDGDEPLPVIKRLGMQDVRFAYVPGKDVLNGVSFEAFMGEAIGIVGPSGAGKSSIVQLLLRLRDPSGGVLRVNGLDARRYRRREWQARVAYVPQTPQLIWGTVSDNIRFYRPHLSHSDIETAARRAHIHDEILSWPQGYQTVIGQRASAVSGGQRQRLCLARALADDPDVLILDEPTSALDVKSEVLVQESLQSLKGELILFLVAHRLSTLSICNRVMVIVEGRLQAMDEPGELVSSNGFYREVTEIARKQSIA